MLCVVVCVLIQVPENRTVVVGSQVRFNCSTNVTHIPATWKKSPDIIIYAHGDVDPKFEKRYRVTNRAGQFDLIIEPVSEEDSGVYICQERAGLGQSRQATLVVLPQLSTTDPGYALNNSTGKFCVL